jgi:ribulose-5-phosphate 4-epimerase/fuculose-1-phosphate aldolase
MNWSPSTTTEVSSTIPKSYRITSSGSILQEMGQRPMLAVDRRPRFAYKRPLSEKQTHKMFI